MEFKRELSQGVSGTYECIHGIPRHVDQITIVSFFVDVWAVKDGDSRYGRRTVFEYVDEIVGDISTNKTFGNVYVYAQVNEL